MPAGQARRHGRLREGVLLRRSRIGASRPVHPDFTRPHFPAGSEVNVRREQHPLSMGPRGDRQARAAGIRWVIVSIHKPCIGLVGTSCPSGQDLLDALLIKKVDLILHGDQHSYHRTKQLRCALRSAGSYFPECIADPDGQFTTAAGSVIAIVGTGGRGFSSVGLTTDADRQYFATAMGSNTPGYGWGYLRVTITATQLTARTAFSGTWQDSFSIGG